MSKKLTKKQIKGFLKVLNYYRPLVGFSDWTIILKTETFVGDAYAQCEPNIYENTLTVEVTEDFLDLDYERQRSIFIHELVHGRYSVFDKIVDEYVKYEEERLINDLERGFIIALGAKNDN